MKTSSGNNGQEREEQLYHKHTFGSMGNNLNSPTNIGSQSHRRTPTPSALNFSQDSGSLQTTTIIPQQQINPPRRIKTSILSTAISSLTYGLSCLIYQTETNLMYECLMMIHEEYINILHVIINRSISYLLKLNDVKSITDEDTFVAGKLNALGVKSEFKENFIVLNLKSLKSLVFVFRTEHQKQTVHLGLRFFLNEGKLFYSKLSQYDPFKAQSMMLFLEADKDGGNLLDIEEILSILSELKINKEPMDIQTDVLQINKSLYERENLKRPKNASPQQLTPIAFEYLLRYYSIKEELQKFFREYCPMFKPKSKNHKNTIIDIIKNNQKPIMSSFQLGQFYRQVLRQQNKSEQDFSQIIKQFPLYDGQGKQKFDLNNEQVLLSFDNFCNLICSKQNSLVVISDQNNSIQNNLLLQSNNNNNINEFIQQSTIVEQRKSLKHYLGYSILNYHIYMDQSIKNPKRKEENNYFTIALKRGVKCIKLNISVSIGTNISNKIPQQSQTNNKLTTITPNTQKLNPLVVRIDQKQKQQLLLDDILKDVKTHAFDKNLLPFFIVLDIDAIFKQPNYMQYLQLLNEVIQDSLDKESIFIFRGNKDQKKSLMVTPLQLQGNIIFMTTLNAKILQKTLGLKKDIQLPKTLSRKITFTNTKLDFQRKGQNCWNCCFIDLNDLKNFQSAEQENISNYSKKLFLFGTRKQSILTTNTNYDSFTCFRQGIQFIGDNFEKNNQNIYIIHSKFAELPEQYFGYKLKPQYMHSDNIAPLYSNKNFSKQLPLKIKFNVLSGQKLILNDIEFQNFHVQVSVKGSIPDEQNNKTYKSEKKTQGFYTEINLECEFVVYNEQMFTIFVVIRNSQNNKILGARAISLKKMREGLRSLQLFNERMQTKENSYLLIYYTRKQIATRDEKATKMQDFLK